MLNAQRNERAELGKRQSAAQDELDQLVARPMRESFVWLYENVRASAAPKANGTSNRR